MVGFGGDPGSVDGRTDEVFWTRTTEIIHPSTIAPAAAVANPNFLVRKKEQAAVYEQDGQFRRRQGERTADVADERESFGLFLPYQPYILLSR